MGFEKMGSSGHAGWFIKKTEKQSLQVQESDFDWRKSPPTLLITVTPYSKSTGAGEMQRGGLFGIYLAMPGACLKEWEWVAPG